MTLQKKSLAKLHRKLEILEQTGPDFAPGLLKGTKAPHIDKIKIEGRVSYAVLVCRGPISMQEELTLLLAAQEHDRKLPPGSEQSAEDRRLEVRDKPLERRVFMSTYRDRLVKALQDEDYRYAYDEEFANSRMATQIKVIREQREGMTQARLAEMSGMRQSRISALENVDYSAWSISTLRRLARSLGVRLSFKFESWGELLSEVETFSREGLQRSDFEQDSAFGELEPTIAANPRLGEFKPHQSQGDEIQEMARLGVEYGIAGSQNR